MLGPKSVNILIHQMVSCIKLHVLRISKYIAQTYGRIKHRIIGQGLKLVSIKDRVWIVDKELTD